MGHGTLHLIFSGTGWNNKMSNTEIKSDLINSIISFCNHVSFLKY